MLHLKLYEDFKENEPAVIVEQLREIDKLYQYFFKYDESLKSRFEIDTTDIMEKQGLNYWYNINLFELENDVPIYYYKIFINIALNDLITPKNKEQEEMDAMAAAGGGAGGGEMGGEMGGEAPVEEAPAEEMAIEEEEYKYEEEAEEAPVEETPVEETPVEETPEEGEDDEEEVKEPEIENCYIKIVKYDHDTSKKIGVWESNVLLKDVINTDWLIKKIDAVDKYTLKVPKNQGDVDKVKKHLKDFTDLHYQ